MIVRGAGLVIKLFQSSCVVNTGTVLTFIVQGATTLETRQTHKRFSEKESDIIVITRILMDLQDKLFFHTNYNDFSGNY